MQEGQYTPFSYSPIMLKPWNEAGDGPATAIASSLGAGSWPVGLQPKDVFDFWNNIKSMFYSLDATVTVGVEDGVAFHDLVFLLNTVGTTKRFWNYPGRSPGRHNTYRANNGVISPNATADLVVDFSQAIYGRSGTKGPLWYPKIDVKAIMAVNGGIMTIENGGTDGILNFESPGAGWAMPLIPAIGLGGSVTSGNFQISSVTVLASVRPIERYDLITFSPKQGPPGTIVTITIPPVNANDAQSVIREGFKHVVALTIGRVNTNFNPLTAITGQRKEIITVTIPDNAKTDVFNFSSRYAASGSNHDEYATRESFVVT